LEDVAQFVKFEIELMGDPRVGRNVLAGQIEFIVVSDRLALGRQKNRMPIRILRLQTLDVAIVIRGREEFDRALFSLLQRGGVEVIDRLP